MRPFFITHSPFPSSLDVAAPDERAFPVRHRHKVGDGQKGFLGTGGGIY
jgi:hypothetical protein